MLTPMPSTALTQLQQLLLRHGFNLGTAGPQNNGVDGDWGPTTAKAFNDFLSSKELASITPPARPPAVGALTIPDLPADYAWLADMGNALPRTIWCGLQLFGTHELAGAANSPTIMAWAAEVGLQAAYSGDAVPWCGLFAAVVAKRANKAVPVNPLWALNWAGFGVAAGQPSLGDVLVFVREGGGHVGFYVGEDDTAYHVLGGNTSDQVKIARIDKVRLHNARRPVYSVQPESVKPFILASTGAMSTNEQ